MSTHKSVHYTQYAMFWVYQQPNFSLKQVAKITQNLHLHIHLSHTGMYLSSGKRRGHQTMDDLEAPSGVFGRQPIFIGSFNSQVHVLIS